MTGGLGGSGRKALRRTLTGGVATAAVLVLLAGSAAAADDVTFKGSLDDRAFSSIDVNAPHELDPERGTVLDLEVTNGGDETVEVRSVRLSANVLGLAFLNYTTRVDLVLEPGETGSRVFALDLGDLGGQARGLLPGQVELLDPQRQVLATQDVPLDVQGSLRSVYAVFGLGIGAITALLFGVLIVRLAAGRLPANRWSRAWRFAMPGIGLGLTASLTLSVLRLVMPSPSSSLAAVVIGVLVGVGIGYLTPAPDDGTGREDLYEEDFVAAPAGAAAVPTAGGLAGLGLGVPSQQSDAPPATAIGHPASRTGASGPARPTE